MAADYVAELAEWIAIPSVSADPAHAGDVRAAGQWLCDRVVAAGGHAELADFEGKALALGELRASPGAEPAPTVLVYGHFDVQPPAPLDLWETPPFEATQRDGWLYGRGVADDKGPLFMLVKAAAELAGAGALPVDVRFACDGEEEVGGHTIVDYLTADERGADVAIVFDAGMLARDVPALTVATRGMAYMHVTLRTGAGDLHSGIYGGAAMNAAHALLRTLQAVLPQDGRLPEPLRARIAPPTDEELESWRALPPGAGELANQRAVPADERAAEEFYLRTWAEPSLDVNGIDVGEAHLQKTVLPVVAEANVSIRLAPGQDPKRIAPELERLLREAVPPGADLEVDHWSDAPPGLVSPHEPAIELAIEVLAEEFGRNPVLVRSGGSLPIVPALASRGIPTILSGFALPDSNFHAPNERLPTEYVERGVRVSRNLLTALASLGR